MNALKVVVLAAVVCACGAPEETRRTFPVAVSGRAPLTTDSGWTVQLTVARLHLSSARFFTGHTVLGRAAPWWRGLLVSEAWAHPGHFVPGAALAEVLSPLEVDLLAPERTDWGSAEAVTGSYGSVELALGDGGLALTGTARRGAEVVPFSATIGAAAALQGLRFERALSTEAGGVRLEVDLGVVFSRVDFARVGNTAQPIELLSPAFNGLTRGLFDTAAFAFTWASP